MGKFIDLTGKRVGRLTVIKRVENDKSGNGRWLCKCDCGNETISYATNLRSGMAKSCGCLRYERALEATTKHGFSNGNRLYRIWKNIKARCLYKSAAQYKDYGGRGITVCDEWRNSFEAFRDWALAHGYADNLSIDRIDVNGNYEPGNCRWATAKEQARNKRNNHIVCGKTLSEWAEIVPIKYSTLVSRADRGLNIFAPVKGIDKAAR